MTNYNRIATTNTNVGSRTAENESLLSVLLSLPAALWQFLCALGTRRVVKGLSLTICIFAFFGIVGGIERYMQKSAELLRRNSFAVHYLYTEITMCFAM